MRHLQAFFANFFAHLVVRRIFPNRSRIIEETGQGKSTRMTHNRLARECALLDPSFEKALAEEGMREESPE